MPEPDSPQPVTDELIALTRAQGDQAKAQAAEFAGVIVAFRNTLADGGFSAEVADGLGQAYYFLLVTQAALQLPPAEGDGEDA